MSGGEGGRGERQRVGEGTKGWRERVEEKVREGEGDKEYGGGGEESLFIY